MNKFSKFALLLLVLAPSVFFISQAFVGNQIFIEDQHLKVTGPGKFQLHLDDIDSVALVQDLPELAGTGGFSLGLIKKGNFIRKVDQKEIRLVKNHDQNFIYLMADEKEFYLNLETITATEEWYERLKNIDKAKL